ncbi:MAG: undecaprenyl-phosphate glucose phosphotransferase [Alphaproteobacteria bacterium]
MTRNDITRIGTGLLRTVDAVVVVAAGLLAYAWRAERLDFPAEYMVAIAAGALIHANLSALTRSRRRGPFEDLGGEIVRIAATWGATLLILVVLGYLTKTSEVFSRLWAVAWLLSAFAGLLAVRVLAALSLARRRELGQLAQRVAVVGAGAAAERIAARIARAAPTEIRLVGIFDDAPPDGRAADGPLGALERRLRAGEADIVIVALGADRRGEAASALARLGVIAADVRLFVDTFDLDLPVRGFGAVAGVPTLAVYERPLAGWSLLAKAIEDKALALLLLMLFAPVMAGIAMAIRLEGRGPVLFRQQRLGFNSERFTVFKFRTMAGAEDGDAVVQARRGDPRVTTLGAFLRRTSLDELPQLVNVLRGDMSLVGPRPHAVVHDQHYARLIDGFLSRHRVKPGMTGWAQVNGLRGEVDGPDKMRRRLEHDLFYIENWSLMFDLRILILTAFIGFAHRNAY